MAYRYLTVKRGGKTVLKHRWLMAQHLGRPLLATEHVHHRNEDPKDNRIENLEVISNAEHQHHHKQKHPVEKTCAICGRVFTPDPTHRERAQVCPGRGPCFSALLAVRRHGVSLAAARAKFLRRVA